MVDLELVRGPEIEGEQEIGLRWRRGRVETLFRQDVFGDPVKPYSEMIRKLGLNGVVTFEEGVGRVARKIY